MGGIGVSCGGVIQMTDAEHISDLGGIATNIGGSAVLIPISPEYIMGDGYTGTNINIGQSLVLYGELHAIPEYSWVFIIQKKTGN